MKIKQGTILPSTAIGISYSFLILYFILIYNFGVVFILKKPITYLLPLTFALMQFSVKDFIVENNSPNWFFIKYRILGFIPIKKSKESFTEYSIYVVKMIRKEYTISPIGMVGKSAQTGQDEYLAIVARNQQTFL